MTGSKGKILVVDDESDALASLTNILTQEGYQVLPADSGRLALASVAAARPDLILLDMQMPGIDGLEVCKRLKAGEASREIPVMFVSALTDTEERVQGLALGAVDYVTKPFERAELLARVQTHLELGRVRSQLEGQVSSRTRDLLQAVAQLQSEIADRKRARQALFESEERFRNMADTAPVMIVVSDPDQRATFFSRGWLDFTGRDVEKELGEGWTAGVHPDDLQRCLAGLSSSFAARKECQIEYRLCRADGQYRWVTCRGIPRFEPGGTFAGYVCSLIDTTDIKRAQEEALAGQKLESLGVLAGGIAHDFNNLLSSILADSELLLTEVADDSAAREGVARIEAVAVRAAEIVRQLMVYAGQECTVFEEVDLAGLVREMLQLVKVSISKNAVLKVDLPEKLPVIRAIAAQIRQVVMNLVTNASDALAGNEGTISVRLSQVQRAGQTYAEKEPKLPSGDCLMLEVSDTGCGMTEEIRRKIFDPFFTTKSLGRGLGLAAVQGIIRSHAGAISVSSVPGRGSRFEVLLPCRAESALDAIDTVTVSPSDEGGPCTGTVLVIDDEDTLRLAVAKMLCRRGFSVLEAGDGITGVGLFRAHAPEIDVVLLDVTLPGMSGREVLGELREIRPNVKVVLTTAYARDHALAAVGGDLSCLYVRKPYQLGDLVELLRRVCSQKPSSGSANG